MTKHDNLETEARTGQLVPDDHADHTVPYKSIYHDSEDIEATEALVLQILKQDREDGLEEQRIMEEKKIANDQSVAQSIWESEQETAARCENDKLMTSSIMGAVVSDQAAIEAAMREECTAERDHALAAAITDDAELDTVQVPNVVPWSRNADDKVECLLEVMSNVGVPSDQAQQQTIGTTSTSNILPAVNCIFCTDVIHGTYFYSPECDHTWCETCVRKLFLKATRDETLYPPRCCGNVFPTMLAMRLLDWKENQEFCQAEVEFRAKVRLYCGDPQCSSFIPPWKIEGERAACSKCNQVTHTACKALGEPDHGCSIDEGLDQVLALAKEQSWRRCPGCEVMVELNDGCNHMTCRCGEQFCYECGAIWRNCSCALWDEDRLMGMAQRVANHEVGPGANEAQREAALGVAVQYLREHAETPCRHHLRSQWYFSRDEDTLQCELCSYVLPQYIFVCKSCQMQVCNRCKMTRGGFMDRRRQVIGNGL